MPSKIARQEILNALVGHNSVRKTSACGCPITRGLDGLAGCLSSGDLPTVSENAAFIKDKAKDAGFEDLAGSPPVAGELLRRSNRALSFVSLHIFSAGFSQWSIDHATARVCNNQGAQSRPLDAGEHVQQTMRAFSKDHSADELLEPELGTNLLHKKSCQIGARYRMPEA